MGGFRLRNSGTGKVYNRKKWDKLVASLFWFLSLRNIGKYNLILTLLKNINLYF